MTALAHVAIIMDGNGRWAVQRGLPRLAGHVAGSRNVLHTVATCLREGFPYLTIYAFSTENWHRPKMEVSGLMKVFNYFIDSKFQTLQEWGVRLKHLGSLENVNDLTSQKISHAINATRDNSQMTLSIAFNYGGRADIINAVRSILNTRVPPESINEAMITAHLSTCGLPFPDLVIRTGGEQRLSNFLLWETANSPFLTTPILWPDFDLGLFLESSGFRDTISEPSHIAHQGGLKD